MLLLQCSSTLNWSGIRLTSGRHQEVLQEVPAEVRLLLVAATLYLSSMSTLTQCHVCTYNLLDQSHSAQAGFNKGDGINSFALPGSGTNEILFLSNTSYVNMPGVWIFQVDGNESVSIGGMCRRLDQLI